MKQIIATDQAPKAIGPYSQAVRANGLIFLSGQIPLDPVSGQLVEGDVVPQTERIFQNIDAVHKAAGSGLEHVVKPTVFLKDMADFARMNQVYATYFPTEPPARSTIEAARLPRDVAVEIEVIAIDPATQR